MLSKLTEPTNRPTAHTSSNRVSVALVIAFIIVISWITSLTQVDWFQGQEYFSEFYIKDASRLLETNHLELSKNEEGTFAVVIVNHEGVVSNYRIHILVNGGQILTVGNIHLEDNGSSEAQIKFSFPTAGENQRVDILLEKQAAPLPYRSLHLLVNVSSNGQDSP
jgi:uncharacterized membrane protein